MTIQMIVNVSAETASCSNTTPAPASITPETPYVAAIMVLRPSVSNKGPSRSGPKKFPAAKGRMYQPTAPAGTP